MQEFQCLSFKKKLKLSFKNEQNSIMIWWGKLPKYAYNKRTYKTLRWGRLV